eukprot:COSAG02_NODE_1565_length_11911_cov_10.325940_11_plen_39_part_01
MRVRPRERAREGDVGALERSADARHGERGWQHGAGWDTQ